MARRYLVLTTICGLAAKPIAAGQAIELDDGEARELLAMGAVEFANEGDALDDQSHTLASTLYDVDPADRGALIGALSNDELVGELRRRVAAGALDPAMYPAVASDDASASAAVVDAIRDATTDGHVEVAGAVSTEEQASTAEDSAEGDQAAPRKKKSS